MKILIFQTLTLFFTINTLQAIIPIKNFTEVNFNAFDKNDLILFDIDETLTQYNDAFLTNLRTVKAKLFLIAMILKHFKLSALKLLFSDINFIDELTAIILTEASQTLIEKNIIDQIQSLQKKDIPICAISKMPTGKSVASDRLEVWRYTYLKQFGFEGSWSEDEYLFKGLHGNPVFYKGILATDKTKKGPALGAFLELKQLKPKRIIMFDDYRTPLESVRKECKKRDIQFQGYLYQGVQIKKWDTALAEFQIIYLVEKKKWLNDNDALKMLYKYSFLLFNNPMISADLLKAKGLL